MKRPTEAIRDAVNDLARRNERTVGSVAREMFLGPELLVVRLARPVVIEGQWEDVDGRTADIFDLMDAYQAESGHA